MSKLLSVLSFLTFSLVFSQDLPRFDPSTYYNAVDLNANINANVNVNVRKDVNVSGTVNVNKNITTIDYGALAQAEALNEQNRLKSQIYQNEELKRIALEIANDPEKAFDYGSENAYKAKRKEAKIWGYNGLTFIHRFIHPLLFTQVQADFPGYKYQNESDKGVITEIEILGFTNYKGISEEVFKSWGMNKNSYLQDFEKYWFNTEDYIKEIDMKDWLPGEFNEFGYVHKIEINKSQAFGSRQSFVWSNYHEDDYEYIIKDNYRLVGDGVIGIIGVRYKGDKDMITFEELESRKYYFRKLMNKVVSTVRFDNLK